jgi:hypothetical protein
VATAGGHSTVTTRSFLAGGGGGSTGAAAADDCPSDGAASASDAMVYNAIHTKLYSSFKPRRTWWWLEFQF